MYRAVLFGFYGSLYLVQEKNIDKDLFVDYYSNTLLVDLYWMLEKIIMIEKSVSRNGEQIIEVRSDAGKLLLCKTKKGYEIKCPRTKAACIIPYDQMLSDCLKCLEDPLLVEEILRGEHSGKSAWVS